MFSRSNSITTAISGLRWEEDLDGFSENNVTLGIDLGEKSACVCTFQNSRVKVIPSKTGGSRTPCFFTSWADISTGNWYHDVGHNAHVASIQSTPVFPLHQPIMNHLDDPPPKSNSQYDVNMNNNQSPLQSQKVTPIQSIKRLIGRSYSDPEVLQRKFPFKIVNEQNNPKIQAEHIRWKDQGRTLFPQEITANLLQHLKDKSSNDLQANITDCVITVPARFNWFQRLAVKDSALIAGFDVVHLINESTAATIAYYKDTPSKQPELVLVFDLGSSSLDLTVVEIDGIKIETKAIGGNVDFGGDHFTDSLTEYCLAKYKRTNQITESNNFNLAELRNKCNWAKEDLSRLLTQKILSSWLHPKFLNDLLTKEDLKEFLRSEHYIDLLSKEELIYLLTKQVRAILKDNGKTSTSTLLITENVPKLLRKKVRGSILKNQNILSRIVIDVKVFDFRQDLKPKHDRTYAVDRREQTFQGCDQNPDLSDEEDEIDLFDRNEDRSYYQNNDRNLDRCGLEFEHCDLEVQISANEFLDLNRNKISKTIQILIDFLAENKIQKNQISKVILSGSSTKIPLLEELLENYFESIPILSAINPEVVVAYGAAIQANSMRFIEGDYFPSKKEILERVSRIRCGFSIPFSIGIAILDPDEITRINGDFGVVIPRNTQIPCCVYKDFMIPVIRGGSSVRIYVGESNFVYENTFWTSFDLNNLPSTRNRKVKVGVTMEISEGGLLRVNSYCWNNKRLMEGTIVDAFLGRSMRSNFVHVLK